MSQRSVGKTAVATAAFLVLPVLASFGVAVPAGAEPAAPLGLWRGTSTCTDRVAAPSCKDEVVVYEFTAGAKPGTVHWQADKVVNDKRELMGNMDLAYDTGEACWRAEFSSPRVRVVWCLAAEGTHMTGTGRLLPGNETVRKIDVRKDPGGPPSKGAKPTN